MVSVFKKHNIPSTYKWQTYDKQKSAVFKQRKIK
ncbi:hypothetical protein BSNT_07199 [Bacillus subtilis subsp. natto BEST195]|nr:hypothetical protein BSNT_07199 [Bacillus subtilis subsp. natto BEST195]